ncbi:MAG: hypothetical protein NC179_05455, partial [[Eubacterium] siraeum]|nr:hypothetical protein [[Eubacterium] siraeum]
RIYVSSNTYAEFDGIDTNGEWKTYEMFIETSPASSTSLTLMLGLGKYNAYYKSGLTTGYAFFDNVTLDKINLDEKVTLAGEEVDGDKAFDKAKDEELKNNEYVTTTTLTVPNGRFDFGSTTLSSSTAPSSWSLVTGNSGKDDPAPTSLGHNAIIDISQFDAKCDEWAQSGSGSNRIMYNLRDGDNPNTNQPYYPTVDLKNAISESIKNLPSGSVGKNVFMLSQQLLTAQGIRSSRTITIEKNKTYAISVDLFTYDIHGAGVSLILSGSDGKDITIKGISSRIFEGNNNHFIGGYEITPGTGTGSSLAGNRIEGASTGAWTTYTFYIKGNQYRDFSYNMAIWLGTDGTSDNTASAYYSYTSSSNSTTYSANGTFSNGWVFIDNLTLAESNLPDTNVYTNIKDTKGEDKYELDCSQNSSLTGIIVDLTSDNLFVNPDNDKYILSVENATTNPVPSLSEYVSIGQTSGAPAGWDSNFDVNDSTNPSIVNSVTEGIVNLESEDSYNGVEGTYPSLPYEIENKTAYMMHSAKESYYEVETQKFTIKANHFYRISLWIKTVDVSSTSGAYIYLLDKSGEKDATLVSFEKINTKDYDEYYNDWCELTVTVRGSNDEDTEVAFKFTLGTGNRWAASTLTSGALFVTNMNMSEITYANFKDTSTGTYVKTKDLSESYTYTFTNGDFDNYDLDDEKLEAGAALANQDVAATPDDWTINDKTVEINSEETSLFAGVVALNKDADDELIFHTSDQIETVTKIDQSVFENFYQDANGDKSDAYLDTINGPNMLAIGSNDLTNENKYAIGFSSASVTLSANTYYQLSVYAKVVGDATASIFLTGESSASTGENYFLIKENSQNGDWTKYTFFIEVGNASVSIKLNLWLGRNVEYMDVEGANDDEKAENAKSAGAVFFDHVVYKTIDNDKYNEASGENDKQISFLTDSFDSLSDSLDSRTSLATPTGWTGASDSTSKSKVGIVYADEQYYTTEFVGDTNFSRLLGLDYTEDDIPFTEEDKAEALESGKYEGMTEDQMISAYKAKKLEEKKAKNWIPVKDLQSNSGHRMLVINNTENNEYVYTSSSNTLKADSYYEISVYVKTYGLDGRENDDTIGANVELYLGSANKTDEPLIFKSINTVKNKEEIPTNENGYVKYTFYVKTPDEDVTDVTLKLSLGSSSVTEVDGESVTSGLTSGYAMFDDVCFQKLTDMTEESFDEIVNNPLPTVAARAVTVDTQGGDQGDDDDDGNNKTSNTFNLDYLWWMIPTIVIGLVIIVVVVVLVIKKFRKEGKKRVAKVESAPSNTEMLDKKRNRYDDNKE